ncbi:DNA mismatch repair protein MutS [Desulfonema magnum]|uniref:DNA mismatch repair protein MutS n=1 Tax=Desulfonema magnum TaxID=45655 RepID=A0A975BVS3_9BACT|nr:DNA mismatch repair protein MutS [Desulfonema magnum]QTA92193.1 DNA mismatch repair protein [Desulfonema magnum]
MSNKTTPVIQQYLSIKEQYKDAILFYRMGDFYEMFFEDAKLASKLLEITLTSRNKKDDVPIPMCGVPVRAVQGYIARLIQQGYKAAICEQTEDAAAAKGIVKREVVRVITPGMIIENEFLDEKSNNYIFSIATQKGRGDVSVMGFSYLDISTGTFRVSESEDSDAVIDEMLRVSPKEILLPESLKNPSYSQAAMKDLLASVSEKAVTFLEDRFFDHTRGRERLLDQFKTLSLEGFGCEHLKAAVSAAGALIYYVGETQKQKIEHLTGIETYVLGDYLLIDDLSCRNLELVKNLRTGTKQGTLLGTIDRTVTAMGGRLLFRWLRYPLMNVKKILARLDAVEEAKENLQAARTIRENLKTVYDLERIGSKIAMGYANARDLIALKRSLNMLPKIASLLSQFKSGLFKWNKETEFFEKIGFLADLIEKAIREDAPPTIHEGGIIKTGYNSELDELITISKDGKGWLAQLEVREKKATGINTLRVRYNKVFGYYIEIPRSRANDVPPHYVRKQTLVNAERYITDELKTFESKVLNAEDRRGALEYELFDEIRKEIVKNNPEIQAAARFVARLDCLLNLSEIAEQNNYVRPEINTQGHIFIEHGRHPVIEKMITGERFVPNTVRLDDSENQILIITGPNMAGKSTILRQVAILSLMAQMGSFVPAGKASVSVMDRIFTRVGALDNLSQGQSTFMVEMQETANILNNATSKSLVIIDEIGRGTSTYDGLSIAWAVAEYLHDLRAKGVKTLFATHYHELTELAMTKSRVKNYNIAVKEWNDEIIFLRKLVEGGTNRSYGIQVARLAGIPDKVIQRAKKILFDIETGEHGDDVSYTAPMVPSPEGKDQCRERPVQLELFGSPGHFLTDELQNLDISTMTPLDALNYLNELQERTKKLGIEN